MIDTSPLSILCSDRPMSNEDRLAEWCIAYNPKPIPDRSHDWEFAHVNYDGAPDSGDTRCGTARTRADAIAQITQGHPQEVTLLQVLRDFLGFALVMAICAAIVVLIAWGLS